MIPAKMLAGEAVIQPAKQVTTCFASKAYNLFTARNTLIVISTATILLLSSKSARTIVTTSYLRSVITSLRLLLHLPLSAAMKESIQSRIDHLEIIYTTRADNKCIDERCEAILKELKTVWDIIKVGIDIGLIAKQV
jgi:hypothetical protein